MATCKINFLSLSVWINPITSWKLYLVFHSKARLCNWKEEACSASVIIWWSHKIRRCFSKSKLKSIPHCVHLGPRHEKASFGPTGRLSLLHTVNNASELPIHFSPKCILEKKMKADERQGVSLTSLLQASLATSLTGSYRRGCREREKWKLLTLSGLRSLCLLFWDIWRLINRGQGAGDGGKDDVSPCLGPSLKSLSVVFCLARRAI